MPFSNDAAHLLQVVNGLGVDSTSGTPLYDAVYRAVKVTAQQQGRRAILVITDGADVGSTLEEVSRRLIEATLAECGSKRKAADMLGISLKTLYNRLAAYKSEETEERDAA